MRHLFASFEVSSMREVYRALAVVFRRPRLDERIAPSGPVNSDDTS